MSLFHLPREIRDHIYSYLIKHEIKPTEFYERRYESTFQLRFHCAIFQVNRQIHYEASQTLYGMNTFAINVDPYSPCIPEKLETLARLSLYPWVKRFAVKVSFLDGLYVHRDGLIRIKKLQPLDALRRMKVRVRTLVKVLSGMVSQIDRLRVDWFLPSLKDIAMEHHLRLLASLGPLVGRAIVAEVRAHGSEADQKDGGSSEWQEFKEQFEGFRRAFEGGEEEKAARAACRSLETAFGST